MRRPTPSSASQVRPTTEAPSIWTARSLDPSRAQSSPRRVSTDSSTSRVTAKRSNSSLESGGAGRRAAPRQPGLPAVRPGARPAGRPCPHRLRWRSSAVSKPRAHGFRTSGAGTVAGNAWNIDQAAHRIRIRPGRSRVRGAPLAPEHGACCSAGAGPRRHHRIRSRAPRPPPHGLLRPGTVASRDVPVITEILGMGKPPTTIVAVDGGDLCRSIVVNPVACSLPSGRRRRARPRRL